MTLDATRIAGRISKPMAQKIDNKETVSLEELAYSNRMEQEALVRLLKKKGIISKKNFWMN
jgi:hypothetical protein